MTSPSSLARTCDRQSMGYPIATIMAMTVMTTIISCRVKPSSRRLHRQVDGIGKAIEHIRQCRQDRQY